MTNTNEEQFSNKSVVKLLRHIAAAYVLLSENRFKIIAYQKAADAIDNLSREIRDVWQEGSLAQVPGIGPSIHQHLDEYFRNGKSCHFDQILGKVPPSVFNLMEIPGIGVKTAARLVKELRLPSENTIEVLKQAAQQEKIETLEGFGKRSQKEILESIERSRSATFRTGRMILPYAYAQAEDTIGYLKKLPFIRRVDALGSLRRMVSTVGDIDLAVEVKDDAKKEIYGKIIKHFVSYPKAIKTDNAGEKKASIIISPNIRIDLRVQEEKSYGSMLQYFTGNKAHNIQLREYAQKKNFSLSEYGIKDLRTKKIHEFSDEKAFYEFLGLQYVPAEIREGTGEIGLAKHNKLPVLVELSDIKGDLHVHSSFNIKPSHDLGIDTFTSCIRKAQLLGYQYIGFAEHNPKSNLPVNQILALLKKKKEQIASVTKETGFAAFTGLEVDIQPTGAVALPSKATDLLDYMIVSVHSSFGMGKSEMTKRIMRALEYPKVKILGHPTGRLINKREGYEADWQQIFDCCSRKNIAVEINAWPERLDLPDMLIRQAKNTGVRLIINTDAHRVDQMDNMLYGVATARRGWLEKKDVLNCLPVDEFGKWIRQ